MKVENPSFQFEISARSIRIFYACVLIINVLLISGDLLLKSQPELPWVLHIVRNQLDLSNENVSAVWYAGIILFLISITALLCFKVDLRNGPQETFQGVLRYGWLLIAGAFAFFSLDEMGSIHERLDKIFPEVVFSYTGGRTGWVTVLWPVIAVVFAYFFSFFWFHLARHRVSQILAFIGGGLLVSVPVQERLEHIIYSRGETRGIYLSALEEGSEVIGATLILIAFLEFALYRSRAQSASSKTAASEGTQPLMSINLGNQFTRYFYTLLFLLATFSLLSALFFVPQLDDLGQRGDPSAWYPTIVLFMAASVGFLNFSLTGHSAGVKACSARWVWAVLGIVSLWFSVDCQAGLTELSIGQIEKMAGRGFTGVLTDGIWPAVTIAIVSLAAAVWCFDSRGARASQILLIGAGLSWAGLFITESTPLRESLRVFAPTLLLISLVEASTRYYRTSGIHRLAVTSVEKSV